ncbi:MAG: ion transporter [Lachnospiraceae bacterium]|nr:ion transporter [Lachnospiraceae bacterium]
MILTIIASIIPLAMVKQYPVFYWIDGITVIIFVIDYILRLVTADFKLNRGLKSFAIYPVTPMALIDLLSILPSLSLLSKTWRLLKIFRLLKTFRVLRVFKAIRYSPSIQLFTKVFNKEKESLVTVFGVAVLYVLIVGLIGLNVEPATFGDYFHAVYWATVSLTTVGYGDIYPVTMVGQALTMVSSFVGIAVVAMPAGIITAGFMEELRNPKEDE